MSEAVTSDLKARLSKVTQERDISLQEAQAAADKLEEVKRKRNELIDSSREYQRVINELQDQLEDVTQRLVGGLYVLKLKNLFLSCFSHFKL